MFKALQTGEHFLNYMRGQCKIYITNLETPCKMNDFLRKYDLLKLTQEEVENWSKTITTEEIGNAFKELLNTIYQ